MPSAKRVGCGADATVSANRVPNAPWNVRADWVLADDDAVSDLHGERCRLPSSYPRASNATRARGVLTCCVETFTAGERFAWRLACFSQSVQCIHQPSHAAANANAHENRPQPSRITWQDPPDSPSAGGPGDPAISAALLSCPTNHTPHTNVPDIVRCCGSSCHAALTPTARNTTRLAPAFVRQHVSPKRGRRAPHHQLTQLVLRTPHFAIVDHCSSQIAPGAHHRSARRQSAAVSAGRLTGCHSYCCCRRGADASCSVPTAAVCGDNRKCLAPSLIAQHYRPGPRRVEPFGLSTAATLSSPRSSYAVPSSHHKADTGTLLVVPLLYVHSSPRLCCEAVSHPACPAMPLNTSRSSRVVMTEVNPRKSGITPQSWHNPLRRFADSSPPVQDVPASWAL
jgi:hypothetical protein